MRRTIQLAICGLALWALATSAQGDQPARPAPSKGAGAASGAAHAGGAVAVGVPADPAFERYADLSILARALRERDAGLLADLGLQLAEGERVLLRTHRSGVTARAVLRKAMALAADRQDYATLDRLGRAAERTGDGSLRAQLRSARKLAATARALDPALQVSLDQTSPEAFLRLRQALDRLREAELLGDAAGLKAARELLGQAGLPAGPKQALERRIAEAQGSLAKTKAPENEALRKLVSVSRDAPWYERPQDWGKHGIIIFPPANNNSSGLEVLTPPSIDPQNGSILSGTSNSAQQQTVVGQGTLTRDGTGRAWWVSNYSNGNGTVTSPVRAPAYDVTLTKVYCSFVNLTNYNVGFSLAGTGFQLAPNQGNRCVMNVAVGQTPVVRIAQLGGGYRDFVVANGGNYAFRVNPQTGQIENYYR